MTILPLPLISPRERIFFGDSFRGRSALLPGAFFIPSLQVMPDVIVCLLWIPCLRARISVPARVPAEWSSPPSSLFRC
uniref:Uncharacterized protein n=1 Tax=Triticum urartu TaxID=4572 RepID=A0A8R7PGD8_TRIUA